MSNIDQFLHHCSEGNIISVKAMLATGLDVNAHNDRGDFGLSKSLHAPSSDVFEYLISHPDINMNQTNLFGGSALHEVISVFVPYKDFKQRHLEYALTLITDLRTTIDLADDSGNTPLALSLFASVNISDAHLVSKALIDRHKSGDSEIDFDWFDAVRGQTYLSRAIYRFIASVHDHDYNAAIVYLDIVKDLLQLSPNLANIPDAKGDMPFMQAALSYDRDLFKIVLNATDPALIDAENNQCATALNIIEGRCNLYQQKVKTAREQDKEYQSNPTHDQYNATLQQFGEMLVQHGAKPQSINLFCNQDRFGYGPLDESVKAGIMNTHLQTVSTLRLLCKTYAAAQLAANTDDTLTRKSAEHRLTKLWRQSFRYDRNEYLFDLVKADFLKEIGKTGEDYQQAFQTFQLQHLLNLQLGTFAPKTVIQQAILSYENPPGKPLTKGAKILKSLFEKNSLTPPKHAAMGYQDEGAKLDSFLQRLNEMNTPSGTQLQELLGNLISQQLQSQEYENTQVFLAGHKNINPNKLFTPEVVMTLMSVVGDIVKDLSFGAR